MPKLPPIPPPSLPLTEDNARELRWRAEDDLRVLQRAKEIEQDKTRLSFAQQVAKEQVQALKSVAATKPASKKRGR